MERFKDKKFWISSTIRINRVEYAFKNFLFLPVPIFLDWVTKNFEGSFPLWGLWIIYLPVMILMLISMKQRMNDLNFIKWRHALLFLFPYILLLILFFKKGKDEANVFGFRA